MENDGKPDGVRTLLIVLITITILLGILSWMGIGLNEIRELIRTRIESWLDFSRTIKSFLR